MAFFKQILNYEMMKKFIMTNKKKLIMMIAVCVVIFSAINVGISQSTYGTTSTILVDISASEKIKCSELFDSIKYVILETSDDILIAEVSKIEYFDDQLLVMDKKVQTLFSFDVSGKLNWQIQDHGQGPEEYIQLMDFDVDESSGLIYLFSRRDKISVYTLDGQFVKRIPVRLEARSMSVSGSKIYLYTGGNFNSFDNARGYHVLMVDTAGNIEGLFPFKNEIGTYIYNTPNAFCEMKDGIRFYMPFETSIYSIDGEELSKKYFFDFGKYNISKNYFDTFKPDALNETDFAFGLNAYWENDSYCSFNINCKKSHFEILYCKKDGIVKTTENLIFDDVGYCWPTFHCATNEYLIGERSAEDLINEYNVVPAERKGSILERIVSNLTEDSNPVIPFYYFK
jgi:hypothetical protein